jgi:hypothetical protein
MSDMLAAMEALRHVDAFLKELADKAAKRVEELENLQEIIKTDPTFPAGQEDVKDLHEQLVSARTRAFEAGYILGEFRKQFNQ